MTSSELPRVLFLCTGNYYRSRFAEELFNHWASAEGVPYRADSAGLWPACHTHNVGPMSPFAIGGLKERGVPLPAALRLPRDVTEEDLRSAAITIAVKEAEHRPLVLSRFPAWAERVEFWHVDDVGDAPPSVALPLLEHGVRELLVRLGAAR
ncbi:MAG: low molecular weight phosphatase family protein [Polyangiaceae bacterium]